MTNTTTAAPYPQTFNTFRAVGALRFFRPGIDMDGGDLDPRVIYSESLATLWQRADFIEAVNSGDKPAAVAGAMRLLSDFLREQTHLGTSMPPGGGHIIRALTAYRLVLKGVVPSLMAWRAARSWHAGSIDDGIGWPPAAGHPVSASIAASVAFRVLWSTRMKP